jgi:hypothetical protein
MEDSVINVGTQRQTLNNEALAGDQPVTSLYYSILIPRGSGLPSSGQRWGILSTSARIR